MQRKERARIASALIGDALRHRLGALKMLAGIEVGALPAGMEFRPALGTLAERVGERRQQRSAVHAAGDGQHFEDRKSTRLNSSHSQISYAVFCLKKKKKLAPSRTSEW